MLEVAVIGAGASALVASRHLVGQGLRPSIFEGAKTLGGAWNTHEEEAPASKMWKGLTTNLSKHTCRFSDWPWPEDTPTFPSALEMNHYLDSYAKNFLDNSYFNYQCQVTNIESLSGRDGSGRYRIEWTDLSTSTKHSKDFGGVVIASGFFSQPHYPNEVDRSKPSIRKHVIHAADYKSPEPFVNKTVAVVGGSFSALEIAVDVSTTAKRVINIVPRVPWVLPRFIPHKINGEDAEGSPSSLSDSKTTILPVDMAFYRRTKEAPELPEKKHMTPEMSRAKHEYLDSLVGRRQEKSSLGIPSDWEEPPIVVISDYYLDLVTQGDIEVIRGRFRGSADDSDAADDKPNWRVETPTGQSMVLSDIDGVICCTGYESGLQEYVHQDILKQLDYDPNDLFCPMTTAWETMVEPSVLPNFFFCGMYRGPYMGVMEMQGRLLAAVASAKVCWDDQAIREAMETSQLRRQGPSATSSITGKYTREQFPHFDYVGFMDTLAQPLQAAGVVGFPKRHTSKGDMVSPAFYQDDGEVADQEMEALEEEITKGQDGSRIPKLVLSAIIGSWDFDRRIVHFSDGRKEHVYGTVRYTRPSLNYVLYREDGFYELSPTKTLNVFREYEYEVRNDCLELYFVEGGERAHLFLSLKFQKQEELGSRGNSSGGEYWVATSDHLCIKDLYQANFKVRLDGLAATEIQMTYRVQGPAKDYESTTILTPKTQATL